MRAQGVPVQYLVYAAVVVGLLLVVALGRNTVEDRARDLAMRTSPLESPSRTYVVGREPVGDLWRVGIYGRGFRFEADVPQKGEVLWMWDDTDHLWWYDGGGLRWWGRLADTFTEQPFGDAEVTPGVAKALCTGVDPAEEIVPPLPLARLALDPERVAAKHGADCPGLGR